MGHILLRSFRIVQLHFDSESFLLAFFLFQFVILSQPTACKLHWVRGHKLSPVQTNNLSYPIDLDGGDWYQGPAIKGNYMQSTHHPCGKSPHKHV